MIPAQNIFRNNFFCAAGAFFGGLEYQKHVVIEFSAAIMYSLRRRKQHAHMPVMAAGMHHIRMNGTVLQRRFLAYAQSIHIASERNRRFFAHINKADHTRRPALFGTVTQLRKIIEKILLCLVLLKTQFGYFMQFLPQKSGVAFFGVHLLLRIV
jgi:hypothetical protein